MLYAENKGESKGGKSKEIAGGGRKRGMKRGGKEGRE